MCRRWWMAGLFSSLTIAAAAAEPVDVQRLLDAAIRDHRPRVELPPGDVRIDTFLTIRRAEELAIEGRNTRLVFSDHNTTAIRIADCKGLTLRGFTIDYDPLPFLQGTVTARADDGTWFDIETHAGYPTFDPEHPEAFQRWPAYVFEADCTRWKPGVPDLYPRRVEIRDARHGRLVFGKGPFQHERIKVGDRIASTKRSGSGMRMDNCENVRVEDVTFLAAPGCALLCRYMRGDNFFRYTVRPGATPAGAEQPRLMSTCADAFNYAFATRGPTLDGCRFSFMGDDSVNLHGATLVVLRRESPTEIIAGWPYSREGLATVIPTGASVRRMRPGTFEVLEQAPLARFAEEKNRTADDLRGIQRVWSRNPADRGTAWRLSFSAPLDAAPGEILDIPASNAPGFVIRNCTFEDHRARGLRIMASQGLIEGNTFRRIKMSAISLGSEFGFWREAGWVDHVTVRKNVLEDVFQEFGVTPNHGYALGAICTFARLDDGCRGPYWPGNRDLVVEENQIRGCASAGIHLSAARGVKIRGNRLEQTLYGVAPQAGADTGLQVTEPIDVHGGVDVQCADNVISHTGEPPQ